MSLSPRRAVTRKCFKHSWQLRTLSAEQVVGGAPAQSGGSVQSFETTPILDGKLITETAETAYKAHHEPRVPLMLGSNSADSAGNRIRATTNRPCARSHLLLLFHRALWLGAHFAARDLQSLVQAFAFIAFAMIKNPAILQFFPCGRLPAPLTHFRLVLSLRALPVTLPLDAKCSNRYNLRHGCYFTSARL